MTIFIRRGSTISPNHEGDITVLEKIPAGVYKVGVNLAGMFLQDWTFEPQNGKVYGDVGSRVERIMTTYNSRVSSMGVLLSGSKGAGKTTLIRILANEGISRNLPVIIIDSQITDDLTALTSFIQTLGEVIVVFDEFEKTFRDQSAFLPLFDGLGTDKKLFVFAVNEIWRVNEFLLNRPGRILYHFKYEGLDAEFVRDYAKDNLKNQTYVEDMVTLNKTASLNFDGLKALVEEMNRYGESPKEALKFLNINMDNGNNVSFNVVRLVSKETGSPVVLTRPSQIRMSDFDGGINSCFSLNVSTENDYMYVEFGENSLKNINNDVFTFESDKYIIDLHRVVDKPRDWSDLL